MNLNTTHNLLLCCLVEPEAPNLLEDAESELREPKPSAARSESRESRPLSQEEVYALKQIQKAHYINKNRKKAYNERDALARGWGTWFVDLLGTFQDSEHIYIVMEFVQGGDFFAYMEKKDKLSMVETRFYMAELISAINAIHQCGFIHRDLKPDNLVLTAQGHLKLLDFGLCTPVDLDEYVTGF